MKLLLVITVSTPFVVLGFAYETVVRGFAAGRILAQNIVPRILE
jgi:hypothetical protein